MLPLHTLKLLLTNCPIPRPRASRAAGVNWRHRASEGPVLTWVARNKLVCSGFGDSLTKELQDWSELTIPQPRSDRFKVSSVISGSTRRVLVFGLLGR